MTALDEQAAQLLNDKAHPFTRACRGQRQCQALLFDAFEGQQAIQPIDTGDKGILRLPWTLAKILQGRPQGRAKGGFDPLAIMNALIKQVAEVEGQQAHCQSGRHRQQQDHQTFGEHAAGVEGGLFDDRDVADLALVQFAVDAGLLQVFGIQGVAFFGAHQL